MKGWAKRKSKVNEFNNGGFIVRLCRPRVIDDIWHDNKLNVGKPELMFIVAGKRCV
jgi:hypothetical protein